MGILFLYAYDKNVFSSITLPSFLLCFLLWLNKLKQV